MPVEAINYPIKTPIPKTAEYLPMLQTLLHIKTGTLPNPIGVSIIGNYTEENYRIKKFNGTLSANLGQNLCANPNNPMIPSNFKGALNFACSPSWFAQTIIKALGFSNGQELLNSISGAGETKEWQLSEGTVNTKTGAVGVKLDTWIFPFMQLFAAGTYLSMQQSTNVGVASIAPKKKQEIPLWMHLSPIHLTLR